MKDRVCPVERAGSLDTKIRRLLQNPLKILNPFICEGMTVMDFGSGPGFFTIDMANLVGKTGRVIAADLQEGMLQKLKQKIQGTYLDECIVLHKTEVNKIGIIDILDFILLFYVVHEIPNQDDFFKELFSIIKPDGQILLVEPPFHVNKTAFMNTIKKAEHAGFSTEEGPRITFNRTVILRKG